MTPSCDQGSERLAYFSSSLSQISPRKKMNLTLDFWVGFIFLRSGEASTMSVLWKNGRNRIAAPTDGHQWRAGST